MKKIVLIGIFFIFFVLLYLYGLYNPSIPVLIYHHINEYEGDMVTISPSDFERQMSYIKDNFNTIHFDEYLSYVENRKKFPPRTCIITFDDGYYDNFVYAYPVLKKYNLKATIFVITSRIGEEGSREIKGHYQANLEGALMSLRGRSSGAFLTWSELEEMQKSGIIDIQSHTHSHARYFSSPEIRDFNSGKPPWWLPFATDGDMRLGVPIYEDQKALLTRRYFDDISLRDYIVRYVAERGGEDFFKSCSREEWRKELFSAISAYKKRHGNIKGHFETERERWERIRREIYISKNEIEKRLKKECRFICWPWGRYTEELVNIAREYGYRGAVTTQKGANTFRDDPMYIKRFDIKTGDIHWFKARISMYNNSIIARIYPFIRGK